MIQAAFFDADGVVVNAEPFSKQLESDYGILREETEPFFRTDFQDCLVGKADLKEVITPWLRKWGWTNSVDDLLSYWFEAENQVAFEVVPYLKGLQAEGILCYLVTNQEKYRTAYLRKEMGLETLFERIYASSDLGYRKSDPEFFRMVLEDFTELDPAEIGYWDDDEKCIEAARHAGINAHLFTGIPSLREQLGLLKLA